MGEIAKVVSSRDVRQLSARFGTLTPMDRSAYKGDLPGSRRSTCLGCDEPVIPARHAHVQFGGRRDGSLLIEIDVEPLISQSNDPDALYRADDLYLLGWAHRDCRDEARRRLTHQELELPENLPELRVEEELPPWIPALNQPPTLDRCPFCDGDDPTREHVYPQWVSRELASLGPLTDHGSEHGPRQIAKIGATAPVCGTCNNRWLSVLENDTKPVLAPMMRGEECRLFADQQRLLATWALKTAMMLDLASGTPVIPAGFFHALRQQRRPFPNSLVFVGGYKGNRWATWARHGGVHFGVAETEAPNGFVTTFTIFRVVFQVVGYFTRGTAEFDDKRIYRDALAQIAPLQQLPVDWPRNRIAFDDEWLETLSDSING